MEYTLQVHDLLVVHSKDRTVVYEVVGINYGTNLLNSSVTIRYMDDSQFQYPLDKTVEHRDLCTIPYVMARTFKVYKHCEDIR